MSTYQISVISIEFSTNQYVFYHTHDAEYESTDHHYTHGQRVRENDGC